VHLINLNPDPAEVRYNVQSFASVVLLVLLTSCSSLAVTAPPDIDLSGTWELDLQRSDARTGAEQEHNPPDDEPRIVTTATRGEMTMDTDPNEFLRGPAPRLPMLTATQMTIDQDPTSMGIAYPKQPYRDLKWGRYDQGLFVIEAGWDEGHLVVQTTSAPLRVKETYSLSDGGATLILQVDLNGRGVDSAHIVRVFRRKSDTDPT
jgi:hypothetical protein